MFKVLRMGYKAASWRALGFPVPPVVALVVGAALAWSSVAGAAADRGQGSGPEDVDSWRRAENDGLNCLFLQLSILGYAKPYEVYLKEAGKHAPLEDIRSLAAVARELGFRLAPARVTMEELENIDVPVVVHLERNEPGTGHFVLVVRLVENTVYVIYGATATLKRVPRDVFRREWSSYALVPQGGTGGAALIRRLLAALMVAWAVASLGRKVIGRRPKC